MHSSTDALTPAPSSQYDAGSWLLRASVLDLAHSRMKLCLFAFVYLGCTWLKFLSCLQFQYQTARCGNIYYQERAFGIFKLCTTIQYKSRPPLHSMPFNSGRRKSASYIASKSNCKYQEAPGEVV